MMSSERWERAYQIVDEVLSRPVEERRAVAEAACGGDVDLRDEVLSLLDACERSPETQEPPTSWFRVVQGVDAPRFIPGQWISGRYRIERLIARGGMGEVYDAWDEELSVQVALKALHPPDATRANLAAARGETRGHPGAFRLASQCLSLVRAGTTWGRRGLDMVPDHGTAARGDPVTALAVAGEARA
jgi:hypothetical protein